VAIPTDAVQDASGDISLPLRRTSTLAEYTLQALSQTLAFFQGEGYLDRTEGIPYFRHVIAQKYDERLLRTLFTKAIERTPGVARVEALALDYANRQLSVRGRVRLTDGNVITTEPYRVEV
jgi:hypothetical protein